jgi:hypothetical protein
MQTGRLLCLTHLHWKPDGKTDKTTDSKWQIRKDKKLFVE